MAGEPTLYKATDYTVSSAGTKFYAYAQGYLNYVNIKNLPNSSVVVKLPTFSAKYIGTDKNSASANVRCNIWSRGHLIGNFLYSRGRSSTATNTEFSMGSANVTLNGDDFAHIFNQYNNTDRFAPYYCVGEFLQIASYKMSSDGNRVLSSDHVTYRDEEWWGTTRIEMPTWPPYDGIDDFPLGGFWLNVPPEATISSLTKDSDDYYAGVTTVSVNVSDLTAYYGGDFTTTTAYQAGVKFEIGSQLATRNDNGSLSITLNATGTFSPKVTVTDSRGQTYVRTFDPITVKPQIPPAASISSVASDTGYVYYSGVTTATVTITDITAYHGGYIDEIDFTIGGQTERKIYSSSEHTPEHSYADGRNTFPDLSLSIDLSTDSVYTPTVLIRDGNGNETSYNLSQISVVGYNVSTSILDAKRISDTTGILEDEGKHIVLPVTIDYVDVAKNYLIEPEISINGEVYAPANDTQWYESWSPQAGFIGSPIDFDKYDVTNYDGVVEYEDELYALSEDSSPLQGVNYYQYGNAPIIASKTESIRIRPVQVGLLWLNPYTYNDVTFEPVDELVFDSNHPLSIDIAGVGSVANLVSETTPRFTTIEMYPDVEEDIPIEIVNNDGTSWEDNNPFSRIQLSVSGYGESDTDVETINAYIRLDGTIYSAGYLTVEYTLNSPSDSSSQQFVITTVIDPEHLTFDNIPSSYGWNVDYIHIYSGYMSYVCRNYVNANGMIRVADVSGHNPSAEGWYIKVPHFTPPVTLYGWLKEDLNTDTSYLIGVTGRTYYKNSTEMNTTIPQAFYLISGAAGGHGLGIGMKVPPSANGQGLHVGTDATFYENLYAPQIPGIIQMFAGTFAPTGWLLCNGDEVAVADYPFLYDVIGDTYGTPSDSDHFVLPDFRGRSPLGAGIGTASDATLRTLGQEGGSERVTLSANQSGIRAHTHGFTQPTVNGGSCTISSSGGHTNHTMNGYGATLGTGSTGWRFGSSGTKTATGIIEGGAHTHTVPAHTHTVTNGAVGAVTGGAVGASESHGNMPPYLTINYIISTGDISQL